MLIVLLENKVEQILMNWMRLNFSAMNLLYLIIIFHFSTEILSTLFTTVFTKEDRNAWLYLYYRQSSNFCIPLSFGTLNSWPREEGALAECYFFLFGAIE